MFDPASTEVGDTYCVLAVIIRSGKEVTGVVTQIVNEVEVGGTDEPV